MTTATATYTIRQSHLRHLEEHCPAFAYATSVRGLSGPSGAGAERGTVVHEFFGRYVQHLYETGRDTDWTATGGGKVGGMVGGRVGGMVGGRVGGMVGANRAAL